MDQVRVRSIQYVECGRYLLFAHGAHGFNQGKIFSENSDSLEKHPWGIIEILFAVDLSTSANGNILTNRLTVKNSIGAINNLFSFFCCHNTIIRPHSLFFNPSIE